MDLHAAATFDNFDAWKQQWTLLCTVHNVLPSDVISSTDSSIELLCGERKRSIGTSNSRMSFAAPFAYNLAGIVWWLAISAAFARLTALIISDVLSIDNSDALVGCRSDSPPAGRSYRGTVPQRGWFCNEQLIGRGTD